MASEKSAATSSSPSKSTPKDALVMQAILKDMNISDYEPRVVNQMLEFTYRYVTTILEDAKVYSAHAKKKSLDHDDVKLAIQMQMDKSFTTPPPRDLLVEIAKQRNSIPLPLLKPQAGPRLPPDRYCLLASNYKLKLPKSKSSTRVQLVPASRLNIGSLSSVTSVVNSVPKSSSAVNVGSKATLSLVSKGSSASPTVAIVTRPAATSSTSKTSSPMPMFRISQGSQNSNESDKNFISSSQDIKTEAGTNPPITIKQEPTLKRKRDDDDDDYDAA